MVTFTYDGTNWCMNESKTGLDSTKLPLTGGEMSGDIQMAGSTIYWGSGNENKIWRDSNNLALQAATQINLKSNTLVSGDLTVDSGHTLTAALKDCTLNNALNAVSNSIQFGPNSSTRGTIGYVSGNAGLTLQFQDSKIILGSSALTLQCAAWPQGSGNTAYITTTSGEKKIVTSGSSKRYKDDITYDLDKEKFHSTLMQMKPCQFHYKTEPDLNQYGFIAEDIEKLDTKLCIYQDDKVENYLDRGVMAIVVSELQRKDEEIKELKARIEKLENKGG